VSGCHRIDDDGQCPACGAVPPELCAAHCGLQTYPEKRWGELQAEPSPWAEIACRCGDRVRTSGKKLNRLLVHFFLSVHRGHGVTCATHAGLVEEKPWRMKYTLSEYGKQEDV